MDFRTKVLMMANRAFDWSRPNKVIVVSVENDYVESFVGMCYANIAALDNNAVMVTTVVGEGHKLQQTIKWPKQFRSDCMYCCQLDKQQCDGCEPDNGFVCVK